MAMKSVKFGCSTKRRSRVYNSDKCQLVSTICKIKDFANSSRKIGFSFEHMYIPVESSRYGSFSFILKGKASIESDEKNYIDYQEQRINLDDDIQEFFFDEGIKKSFWKNLKESVLLEPNFNGIGIDMKKLFKR